MFILINVYIIFKNEVRHSNDSAFQSLKVFISAIPGRVESYIVESYVIDTADDIAFGCMNNSVFMLLRVAFSMSIHMAVCTLSC